MRVYGQWAGRPDGHAEDKSRCVAEVCRGYLFAQCQYKRGKGPGGAYCGRHASALAKGRIVNVPEPEAE